jgi:hypothetical protein
MFLGPTDAKKYPKCTKFMSTIESTLKKQPKVLKTFLDGRVFEEMAYGSPNICHDDEIFDALTSFRIRPSWHRRARRAEPSTFRARVISVWPSAVIFHSPGCDLVPVV